MKAQITKEALDAMKAELGEAIAHRTWVADLPGSIGDMERDLLPHEDVTDPQAEILWRWFPERDGVPKYEYQDGVPVFSTKLLPEARAELLAARALDGEKLLRDLDELLVAGQRRHLPELNGISGTNLVGFCLDDAHKHFCEWWASPDQFSIKAAWARGEEIGCLAGDLIRGDWTSAGDECEIGFSIAVEEVSSLFEVRNAWDIATAVNKHFPPRFAKATLANLEPWARSPVPIKKQQKAIGAIPGSLERAPQGWLLVGPPGTSKTTYVVSALRDWISLRLLTDERCRVECHYKGDSYLRELAGEDSVGCRLDTHLYVVHVPDWLDEIQAWEYRTFGDSEVAKPSLTPKMITETANASGVRPVLLLEELDKFSPTKNRQQMLFRLVDAVYRADGYIVATANTPLVELKQMLGEPVYRRIAGDNDAEGTYLVWDFFKWLAAQAESEKQTNAEAKGKKTRAKPKPSEGKQRNKAPAQQMAGQDHPMALTSTTTIPALANAGDHFPILNEEEDPDDEDPDDGLDDDDYVLSMNEPSGDPD